MFLCYCLSLSFFPENGRGKTFYFSLEKRIRIFFFSLDKLILKAKARVEHFFFFFETKVKLKFNECAKVLPSLAILLSDIKVAFISTYNSSSLIFQLDVYMKQKKKKLLFKSHFPTEAFINFERYFLFTNPAAVSHKVDPSEAAFSH